MAPLLLVKEISHLPFCRPERYTESIKRFLSSVFSIRHLFSTPVTSSGSLSRTRDAWHACGPSLQRSASCHPRLRALTRRSERGAAQPERAGRPALALLPARALALALAPALVLAMALALALRWGERQAQGKLNHGSLGCMACSLDARTEGCRFYRVMGEYHDSVAALPPSLPPG